MAKPRWTPEEDHRLIQSKHNYAGQTWSYIAEKAGLRKTRKQCSARWTNHLSPDVNKEDFSQEEDDIIRDLRSRYENSWASIASELERQGFKGRTANAVKNRWHNHLSKSSHLNITGPQSCTSHQPDPNCCMGPSMVNQEEDYDPWTHGQGSFSEVNELMSTEDVIKLFFEQGSQ